MNQDEKGTLFYGIAWFGVVVGVVICLFFLSAPQPPKQPKQKRPPINIGKAAEEGSEHVARGMARGLIRGIKDGFKKEKQAEEEK